jgi:arsenate reductase-like glutaredoxin family protein
LAVAEDLGVDHEVILYIKTPPDEATLTKIVGILEDPVEDLVRKDSKFKKLELNPDGFRRQSKGGCRYPRKAQTTPSKTYFSHE